MQPLISQAIDSGEDFHAAAVDEEEMEMEPNLQSAQDVDSDADAVEVSGGVACNKLTSSSGSVEAPAGESSEHTD